MFLHRPPSQPPRLAIEAVRGTVEPLSWTAFDDVALRQGIRASRRCPCVPTAAIDVKEKKDMHLPKHLSVGVTVVIAMAATTAGALGASHSTTGQTVRASHAASGGAKVAVANSGLGRILVDGRGHTL